MTDENNYSAPDELITAALNEAFERSGMNKTGFVYSLVHGTSTSKSTVENWIGGKNEPGGRNLCELVGLLGTEFGTRLLAAYGLRVVQNGDKAEEQRQAARDWYEAGAPHFGSNVTRLKGAAG